MQTSMKSPRYEQHITCLPNCLWCIEAHQPPKYHITFSKADHDRHRGECCFQALIQSCLENATCMVHTSCDRASMRACLLYMAQPLLQKPADYGRPCMYTRYACTGVASCRVHAENGRAHCHPRRMQGQTSPPAPWSTWAGKERGRLHKGAGSIVAAV